jgi:hypothetical protein
MKMQQALNGKNNVEKEIQLTICSLVSVGIWSKETTTEEKITNAREAYSSELYCGA